MIAINAIPTTAAPPGWFEGFLAAWDNASALHMVAEIVLAIGYIAIPLGIVWVLRTRPDIAASHRKVALLLAAFIFAGGLIHLADITAPWWPSEFHWGIALGGAALVSTLIAARIVLALPLLLAIPSIARLEATNAELSTLKEELARSADDRARALAVTSQRLEAAIFAAPILIASQDRDLVYNWVSHPALGHGPSWFVGKSDYEVLPEPARATIIANKLHVLETGEPTRFEVDTPYEGEVDSYDIRVLPSRARDGSIDGVITAAIKVTERKRREERIKLLIQEMSHRIKNIFAVVQAITRQTASYTTTKEEFVERFGARLSALASSHSLMFEDGEDGVSLPELVAIQLAHFGDLLGKRILLSGPDDIALSREQLQAIGLGLHELATNAVKYGALSQPTGTVHISWSMASDGRDDIVNVEWREAGGPNVEMPYRHGFGRVVVETLVPRAVQGRAELLYRTEGIVWRLRFPRCSAETGAAREGKSSAAA